MIDGPQAHFAFERAESRFNFRQLDVLLPELGWIFFGEVCRIVSASAAAASHSLLPAA
jgi:hypothetical protein